jgi:hypothetical protein
MKARDAVEVQEMEALRQRVTRWKVLFGTMLSMGLGLAVAAGVWGWRYHTRGLDIADPTMAAVSAMAFSEESNLLSLPAVPIPKGEPIPGWTVHVGDRRNQSVAVGRNGDDNSFFVLTSGTERDELRLGSPDIEAPQGTKFCLESVFKKSADFSGAVSIVVSLSKIGGSGEERIDRYLVKEPVQIKRTGDWAAKQTFTLPAASRHITLQIRGRFTGEVRVSNLSLVRTK